MVWLNSSLFGWALRFAWACSRMRFFCSWTVSEMGCVMSPSRSKSVAGKTVTFIYSVAMPGCPAYTLCVLAGEANAGSWGVNHSTREGLLYGLAAYAWWGLVPIYFHWLGPVGL